MSDAMMDRLTKTIARDSRLESLPLLALVDGAVEIVSGHHRVRGAEGAGLDHYHALVDVTGLDRQQIIAKQLAHNAIAGYDDQDDLEFLLSQITDDEIRAEAYVDDDNDGYGGIPIDDYDDTEDDPEYRYVTMAFLPHQEDLFRKVIDAADVDRLAEDSTLFLADIELANNWLTIVSRAQAEFGPIPISAAVARLIDHCSAILGVDFDDPTPDDWVPLTDIIGSTMMDPDAAAVVEEALHRARAAGDIPEDSKANWRLIELLAADYLAGA